MSEAVHEGLGPLPEGKELFRVVLNPDGVLAISWHPRALAALLESDALGVVIHGLRKQARDREELAVRYQRQAQAVLDQLGVQQ